MQAYNIESAEHRESCVRNYSRLFPVVFCRAKGSLLYSQDGREYLDFWSAAGALNYGHNNDFIKERLVEYILSDGVVQVADLHTVAKFEFLEALERVVLLPRGLEYKVQFCGPTGTNAIEAALKLARKITGRLGVFAFMGGYHGVTAGSLAVTADKRFRGAAGVPLNNVTFFPFPGCRCQPPGDPLVAMEMALSDPMSGTDVPSAVVVETVQAEGGVYVAPPEWLLGLRHFCDTHHILLICDEIQAGCGRTGPFLSFDRAAITPDIIALSKSISGIGIPLSLLLIRPDYDQWEPGEHNGTFRANQLAFVAGTAALDFRESTGLGAVVENHGHIVSSFLHERLEAMGVPISIRGLGLLWGIDLSACGGETAARAISVLCFERGLIVERVGPYGSVLKIAPPLTTELPLLLRGCQLICDMTETVVAHEAHAATSVAGCCS